jgi:hypothetical protein
LANPKADTLAAIKALQANTEAIAPQRSALRKVEALVQVLSPEQEMEGIALPVLAEVIGLARSFVADDPVVKAMQEVISPDLIAANVTVRAADALLVATQLRTALHEFRPSRGVT